MSADFTVTFWDGVTVKKFLFIIGFLLLASSSCWATDRYALTSGGTSAGTCTTIGSPCTVDRLLTQLVPGDTGFFCATDCDGADSGTYTGWFNDSIPSGTSFSNAVTLKPYTGESITLQPAAGAERVFNFYGNDTQYIIVSGFVMDCVNVGYDCVKVADASGTMADHIRIQNNELKNAKGNGILLTGGAAGVGGGSNEILSNNIHDCATFDFSPFGHAVYITSASNLVDGNTIHDNSSDTAHNTLAVHIYNSGGGGLNNNIVRNNVIYNNTRGGGILAADGTNTQIYNNVIYNNYVGITAYASSISAIIYSNTIYGSTLNGIDVRSGATTAFIRNNIAYNNGTNYTDAGTGTTHEFNLEGTNPSFVDAASGNFNLLTGSAAIDYGTTLGGAYTTDIVGTSRPQGSAYDAGAYEFVAPPAPPSGGGSGVVGYDSACAANASGSTISFSCTVANNPNRVSVLFVAIGTVTGTTVSSASFNGVSYGASICSITETSGSDMKLIGYLLKQPDVGTFTVSVTLSDSAPSAGAGVVNFYGVNQTTPNRTPATAGALTGNPTVAVTTSVGDLVVDAAYEWNSSPTAGTDQTARFLTQVGSDPEDMAGSTKTATTTSTTMSWTFVGPDERWTQCAVPLIPGASLGAIPILARRRY